MSDKQPEIFKYLDGQFKDIREYNDKKFTQLFQKVTDLHVEVEKIKDKDKPSPPCRDLIIELHGITEEKCGNVKKDIDKVSEIARKRVTWGVAWVFLIAIFLFTSGSYIYTWNTNNRIDALRLYERENK